MRKRAANVGFTLIEVLLAATIMALCLSGLLLTYINLFILTDLARDFTLAANGLQLEMEKLKVVSWDNLAAANGTYFNISGFNTSQSRGVIEITNTSYSDLKEARLIFSFSDRGRLIGEDANFNGRLDLGEDQNDNDRLDSPAELVTLFTNFAN
jgi:prepilin-type N-terminal cleavage/methylation domain-containing protein